jgi:preprotein translocase subunit SecB
LLFPYARETIANLSLKAGFPPLELQPINFEALHNEQMANEQG